MFRRPPHLPGAVTSLVQEARGSPNPKLARCLSRYGNGWEADADAARALILRRGANIRKLKPLIAGPKRSAAAIKDLRVRPTAAGPDPHRR